MKGSQRTNNVHLCVRSKCTEGGDHPVTVYILCSAPSVIPCSVPGGWWGAPRRGHGNCKCVCGSWLVLPVPLFELKESWKALCWQVLESQSRWQDPHFCHMLTGLWLNKHSINRCSTSICLFAASKLCVCAGQGGFPVLKKFPCLCVSHLNTQFVLTLN